jgi:hypothetical protein
MSRSNPPERRWGRAAPWLAAAGGVCAAAESIGSLTGVFHTPEDEILLHAFLVMAVAAWSISEDRSVATAEGPIRLLLSLGRAARGPAARRLGGEDPGVDVARSTRTRRAASSCCC